MPLRRCGRRGVQLCRHTSLPDGQCSTFVWRIVVDEIKYIVGLDLGQTNDYTALAILERTRYIEPPNPVGAFGGIHSWYGLNTVPASEAQVKKKKTYAVRH